METPTPTRNDGLARALRGVGPLSVLATVAILLAGNLVGGVLAFVWAWRSGTPLHDLGFRPVRSWARLIAFASFGGVLLKLVMKALVMPLLGFSATNAAYQYLVGNRHALPGMLLLVMIGGGLGEETIWRGFLFERLERFFGGDGGAKRVAVGLSSILFALAHYADQGLSGAAQALVTGLVFGAVYVATDRIWPSMVAHAAFDVTAVLIIYWNLEAVVAHVVFR
jgi:uncharacterized protein